MLTFSKIANGDIFTRDFNPFLRNNVIEFSRGARIAVLYGPNGTGKTSLIKALSENNGSEIEFDYEGQTYTSCADVFHIINDQNDRNIIKGETADFLLGDNIRKEVELQKYIADEREKLIDAARAGLKAHKITAASSLLLTLIVNPDIAALIKDLANSRSKGQRYTAEELVTHLDAIAVVEIPDYDEPRLQFLQEDMLNKDGLISKIETIATAQLKSYPRVREIEENTEAIDILKRFCKDDCIVCDAENIDREGLLESKIANRKTVVDELSEEVRSLIKKAIDIVPSEDPFGMKSRLVEAISQGNNAEILKLLEEIGAYKALYNHVVLNELAVLIKGSDLPDKIKEYQVLVESKPDISDEDYLYIREIISSGMDKKLTVERDSEKNLKILLSDQVFLGESREDLPLSAGEQNFLSLTFELLKAKNSPCPIVIIDDPISSFDSIYKNKVAYAIVRILQHKKRIVLTHNTDLLRLLEGQFSYCYKLFLLNNTDGESNGFIALNRNEQGMLISLERLLLTFRDTIFPHIVRADLFLISMIPFMRGYANIIGDRNTYDCLTQLMHGYMTEKVDIAHVYKTLFGKWSILPETYEVCVADILNSTVDGDSILDTEHYPLLNKTLRHSFTYLYLRLLVEKALIEKFGIDTTANRELGAIIAAAFPDEEDATQIRNRIRLTSKKTLINEFNHFEGNLSIFQPAIDITDQALGRERTEIVTFVSNL